MKKFNLKKGFLNKVLVGATTIVLGTSTVFSLAGCGNHDIFDTNYKLYYAVIEENEDHVLHKIKTWSDSESDSVMVRTECCGNYIWTSANKATLYEKEPDSKAYDRKCDEMIKE